jgi:hypothetical protein
MTCNAPHKRLWLIWRSPRSSCDASEDGLKRWKPPGCARFQRAGFGRGPMKEACTLEDFAGELQRVPD